MFFIGSSGLQISGVTLAGVSLTGFYVAMAIGVASYLASVFFTRRLTSIPRPSRTDASVLFLMLIQAGIILIFFQKYPIFPEYDSVDLRVHVNIVNTLLSGGSSIPGGILYYGVHYQLALGTILSGDQTLIAVQRVGAILAILATPLIFSFCSRIMADRRAGLFAAILYSLAASIWFGSLFNTGLYSNFFGILASLLVLMLTADVVQEGLSVGRAVPLSLGVAMLYLSHYSDVSVIPAVLTVPLILLATGKLQRRSLAPPLALILPAVLVLASYPGLVGLLLGFLANAGGNVVGGTFLSGALSPVPVVAFMAIETYYDVGFVLLSLLAAFYAWWILRERDAVKLMVLVWLLSVVLVAPLNSGAWRLSYVALVPLTIMAAGGLSKILPVAQQRRQKASRYGGARRILVGVLLILLLVGSWGVTVVSDSTTLTQVDAQAQANVYNSILWIGNNTKGGAILSVSDFRYLYAPQLIGRDAAYEFISTPSQALPVARSRGFSYIAVTRIVTASVPAVPSLFPWNNFPTGSNANLTLVYSNPDVRIFKVV